MISSILGRVNDSPKNSRVRYIYKTALVKKRSFRCSLEVDDPLPRKRDNNLSYSVPYTEITFKTVRTIISIII